MQKYKSTRLSSFLFFIKQNRSFLLFMLLMFAFRSAVADWNTVPTGSMKPTIVEGDRILIDKTAYDIRMPFIGTIVSTHADPKRGEIIVFNSEAANKRLVKRVIGVPGDSIALRANKLTLNGQALSYSLIDQADTDLEAKQQLELVEELGDKKHKVWVQSAYSRLANFSPVTVPADHYLVMGDNRDNSSDSRVIGFIPRDEIIGRANTVVLSLNYDNYYIPRSERFFKAL